jgi:hypothetical protein
MTNEQLSRSQAFALIREALVKEYAREVTDAARNNDIDSLQLVTKALAQVAGAGGYFDIRDHLFIFLSNWDGDYEDVANFFLDTFVE